jgi:hypothetical protein
MNYKSKPLIELIVCKNNRINQWFRLSSKVDKPAIIELFQLLNYFRQYSSDLFGKSPDFTSFI